MDRSPEYIKQCEKAKEIQRLWKPTDGDFAWHPDEGEDYLGCWEFPAETVVVKITEQQDANWWLNWLWLPRQDQLQEMIGDGPYNNIQNAMWSILDDLHKYAFTPNIFNEFIPTSMNQLWLAFVQKEKYGKVWNGEEWVRE